MQFSSEISGRTEIIRTFEIQTIPREILEDQEEIRMKGNFRQVIFLNLVTHREVVLSAGNYGKNLFYSPLNFPEIQTGIFDGMKAPTFFWIYLSLQETSLYI